MNRAVLARTWFGYIRRWLASGYVMGVHDALVLGIPGLKSETWGPSRFPVSLIGNEDLCTGLGARTFQARMLCRF